MILLIIVYIAFISLGLPDSLLGSAWPVMHGELGVPISYMGAIAMIISGGTILSSFFSDRLIRRFGTGPVTAVSILFTAVALFGFSISGSFVALCLWSIPYGLGAGAVDAALNNYVALHFVSRHMNWLHCTWGIGASVSPYIMGYSLTGGYGWNIGYRIVSIVLAVLTSILFICMPLWKRNIKAEETKTHEKALGLSQALKIKGVPLILITFCAYCGMEQTASLWASSYLVQYRGISPEVAAQFASLFFIGLTAGRFLCGFIAEKLGDKRLVRIGILVAITGIVMMLLPVRADSAAMLGLVVIGLGCGPVYPCIIHATPSNFGRENSQAIIGIQMACAYMGTTFLPPLFGLIAENVNIGLLPLFLIILGGLVVVMWERINEIIVRQKTEK